MKPDNAKTLGITLAIVGGISLGFYISILIGYFGEIGIISEGITNDQGDNLTSTEDLPLGLLLTIELAASFVILVGGLLGIYGSRDRNIVVPMFILSMMAFLAFSTTGIYRSVTIWGEGKGQCEYFGSDGDGVYGDLINSCPTTRHALMGISGPTSDIKWKMEKTEPTTESDCVFWFWDTTNPLRVMKASSTNAYRDTVMIRDMDWTQKHPYGWYLKAGCAANSSATDCIEDGRTAYKTLESDQNLGVPIVEKMPTSVNKPDISHCYYWGCSRVCNGDRFLVNRILLYASLGLGLTMLIVTMLSGYYWNKKSDSGKKDRPMQPAELREETSVPGLKPTHFRKRTLRF